MSAASSSYRALKSEDNDGDTELSPIDGSEGYHYADNIKKRKPGFSKLLIPISLAISLVLNLVLVTKLNLRASHDDTSSVSRFAKLKYNVPMPFEWHTAYNGEDQVRANELWDALGAEIDAGFIAVPDEWSTANGLLEAQRFPWDTSKGVYLVNGQHNLHCLKNIRSAYMEYYTGQNQSKTFPHINHCFDAVRQDIMCHADDTPRYTTTTADPESGVGQIRQCRSWTQLQKWSRERTACFRNIHEGQTIHNIERYQFCPPGSPYLPKIREYFKHDEDWQPSVD